MSPQAFLPGETGGIPNVLLKRLRQTPLEQFLERLRVPELGTRRPSLEDELRSPGGGQDPVGFPDEPPPAFPQAPTNPFRRQLPQALTGPQPRSLEEELTPPRQAQSINVAPPDPMEAPVARELPENYSNLKAAGMAGDQGALPLRRTATIPPSPSLKRELETPFPPPSRSQQIQGRLNAMDQPLSLKQMLLRGALTLGPVALAGAFGGEAAASGAAQGAAEAQQSFALGRQQEKRSLREELENERQREARAAEFQAQREENTGKFAEDIRQFNLNQQNQGATLAEQIRHNKAVEAVKESPIDKEVHTYTNDQGQQTVIFQKPTGETYERSFGKVFQKAPDQSFEEATYEDFKKDPALTQKYGPTHVGYVNWLDDKAIAKAKASRPPASPANADDAKTIAAAIIRGEQPPVLTGLYRQSAAVRAELARQGFDLATANRDWTSIQRHLATLNGAQQERLRQAVTFTSDSLDNIEGLYAEWKQVGPNSGFKILNRGALAAAKQLPGKPGELAQNLEAQINDLVSELGTVYKGGNASTDETLRLAAENLKADWNEQTFARAIKQIRKNLDIRRNSILTSQPVGVSPQSPYNPTPGVIELERGPDGKLREKRR